MASPTLLYDTAHLLLTALQTEFAADLVSLPLTSYVYSESVPVAECDSLVVGWESIFMGQVAHAAQPMPVQRSFLRSAKLVVWVFRCLEGIPQGEQDILIALPPISSMDKDAKQVMTDGLTVFQGITRAHFNGNFKGYADLVSIGPTTPIPSSGGIGGSRTPVEVQLLATGAYVAP